MLLLLTGLCLLSSCSGGKDTATPSADSGGGAGDDTAPPSVELFPDTVEVPVVVTLDGSPLQDATLAQGGNPARWTTDADGTALVLADSRVEGDLMVMASHPEARIVAAELDDAFEAAVLGAEVATLELALVRFDTSDNPAYVFQDPGEPERRDTTAQCAHCHVTLTEDWYASEHRTAASNPVVHDLYAGVAAAWSDEDSCVGAGGQWWTGLEPGTGVATERCYLGAGALPDLNEDCGDTESCDGVAEQTGGCADCHAPGIDGELGGRDLLAATDHAYDYGVHCDVCHKIADVDVDDPDPGVAGKLHLVRPSEDSSIPSLDHAPLTFGPYDDVPNPRMGSVAVPDLYRSARLCAGCHQHDVQVELPGAELDPDRWPEGLLPVQSTWEEWRSSPFGTDDGLGGAPCQSCHMPADGDVGNSADLGNFITSVAPGIAAGWWREPGEVRRHTWFGPRHAEESMIDLAASLELDAETLDDLVLVQATVRNIGPGHALPTGEPMRHLVLLLEARCGEERVEAVGGQAVPDLGGWLDRREADEGWSTWPGAQVGDLLRVVERTGTWHDYAGFGPFGDGSFSAEDKGLPEELVVGAATVIAVDGDTVELDQPLPEGDVAYRVDGTSLPSEGEASATWAGAPGFAFARVLEDADGNRMVPHWRAVDVALDNRLLPQQSWTSEHRFPTCADALQVDASLIYRAWPLDLAAERGWGAVDRVMVEARVEAPEVSE